MDWEKMKTFMSLKMLAIIFGIVVLCCGIYIFYFRKTKTAKTQYQPNFQNNKGNDKLAELMFFYADWCPHCKQAKGEWSQLKTEYENKQINGYNIVFREINCTTESPETDALMSQYDVEGYPTFKLVKEGGDVVSFEAKATKDNLSQFLQTML